jgi:transcriptional antiterminator RfaH
MPCGGISGPAWFVVQSHHQAERWACANLQRRGYRTFLPLVAVRRRDRVIRSLYHTVEVPLFSPYLFIHFDARSGWTPIWNTPGVARLLMADGKPAPCPERAVEAIQAGAGLRRTLTPPEALWRPGAACRLAGGGAFDGHDAVVTAVHHDRALVALLMLGHLREVQVSLDCLATRD